MARENSILVNARKNKRDEFYTQWNTIEQELVHYEDQLRGKSIICNCDDVEKSNFIEYLCRQAPYIGITKVIGVRYEGPDATESWYVTYTPPEDIENYNADNWKDYLTKTRITGNGGFETPESIELLDQCDVCITNPPFSLFRNFINLLIEHEKLFLTIGNVNAVGLKEIFPLIKNNKIWIGYKFNGSPMMFNVPEDYPSIGTVIKRDENGQRIIAVGGTCWFTNLEVSKRNEPMILVKEYYGHEEEYLFYDNYPNVIEVSKTCNIPRDYNGIIGVPITWIDKYCPTQFEIVGLAAGNIKGMAGVPSTTGKDGPYIDGKLKYNRIFIRRRQQEGES